MQVHKICYPAIAQLHIKLIRPHESHAYACQGNQELQGPYPTMHAV